MGESSHFVPFQDYFGYSEFLAFSLEFRSVYQLLEVGSWGEASWI
jgi:hypothetical protein